MAYAVKYLFKFQSSNGTVREIRVLQDGYSGAVIQRPLGRAPVIKKEQNGGVHGTSLTFYAECHVDREFIEFYTSDPKEYRVDVYAGSTLLWQGYITPELYSEPDIAPPYDVEVVATDGVGELKLYDFAPQGTVTLRSLLSYLLGYTGLSTDVNLVSSLKPGSRGAGALLDMQICVDYLAGKTCYEALTYLLDTLNATITRWGGAWLLVRETNVTFTNDKVRYFNTAGNSALLSGSVQTLGSMRSAPAWPVGQLSMVIDPAKNKVAVQAPWHPVTCLANADMASDTAWAKANNASYGPDGYLFPNNDTGGSSYATAHISQSIASAGLRVPMSFELKATGVAAQVGARVGAVIGVLITYTVGNTVYLLRRGDEGTPVWKEGSAPGSSIDGSLVDYQQPLASFDADRIQAETLSIDEIPAFVQGTSYPSGTLTVYVIGTCARAYSAHLDVVLPKGYQDVLRIDNGARGEGDTVEIAIGRETAEVAYYAAFLQGLLLDNGALITSFSDANFEGMNYLALIARDYALSVALPRASVKGNVYLESSIGVPPLVFAKGGLNYWIETWSWDLYEDELEISARTLPSASLTVQSETILESDGSTVSSASTAGSSGGGGGSFPGGVNYFELDDTLVRLKGQYDYLGPRKGLIFEGVSESDADLYVKEITVGNSTQRVLYSPLPLITEGDQIVGSGTPGGGGGGGATYMRDLEDVSLTNLSNGQMLAWDASLRSGQGAWKNVPAPTGTITSVALASGTNNGTLKLTVNGVATDNIAVTGWSSKADASALANYLPLSAGSSYPLTSSLYVNANTSYPLFLRGHSQYSIIRYLDSSGNNVVDIGWVNDARGNLAYIGNLSSGGILSLDVNGCYYSNDSTPKKYTIYHSGNAFISNNTITLGSSSTGTITNPIAYATQAVRFKQYSGSSTAGGFDLNTLLAHGGITAQYSSAARWANAPYGMSYGGAVQFGTNNNEDDRLDIQFAWDVVQSSTAPQTGRLWWRDKIYNESSASSVWGDWFEVYHSGNLTKSVLTGLIDASGGYYLPLTGGTLWNNTRNFLKLSTTDANGPYIEFQINNNIKGYVGYYEAAGVATTWLGAGSNRLFLDTAAASLRVGTDSTNYTVYHTGNSNKSDVAWACSTLTASGAKSGVSISSVNDIKITAGSGAHYLRISGEREWWVGVGATSTTDGKFTIYDSTGTSIRLVIDSSGNVGMGTTSPATKLEVNGSIQGNGTFRSRSNYYNFSVDNSTGDPWYGIKTYMQFDEGATMCAVRIGASYANQGLSIGFSTGNAYSYDIPSSLTYTERVIITKDGAVTVTGNVGIGTSSPGYTLDVNGIARANRFITGATDSGIAQYAGLSAGNQITSSLTINDGAIYYSGHNLWVWATEFRVFGTLVSTGDQVVSSDINLKENLAPVAYSVEDIAKTRAVTFDWKDGRGKSAGSIAQDWKPLIPELVHGEEGRMTLAYGQIALVNTIIEAREIEVLKKRVAELEAEVKRLRS